jgi:hypothetical protein
MRAPVITDIYADGSVLGFENGIAQIARREVELLPESGMHVRDVVLAVLAQIASVCIDDCGSIEIHSRHLLFVNRDYDCHLMFGGDLLHQLGSRSVWNSFCELVPADVLLGAEIGAVEQLLQAKDFHFFLCRLLDKLKMLVDHGFLDLWQRAVAAQHVTRLDEATAHNAGHECTSARG